MPRPPITPIEEMGRIPLSEVSDTPPLPISFSLDERTLVCKGKKLRLDKVVELRLDAILGDPQGLPNGKGNRTKLDSDQKQKLKSALKKAVEDAHVWASKGRLPNRVPGRGRPPDNAKFIFIDDITRACEGAGLKPGLRYIDPVSLPVHLFIELHRLLWGPVKDPRRFFERWQRYRKTLVRG